MRQFFQYMYYRMAKLHPKKKYQEGTLSVTMVQFLVVINAILVVNLKLFNGEKRKFNSYEIIIFLVIFFGLDYYNNKLYKGRFEEFDARWGNEPKKKKVINMIVIVLAIIIAWGLAFINAWIFGRFKTY
jgi:hypothetical protein